MTEKIFEKNAYQKEFMAKVLEARDGFIVLDKTCFYPQSGGQVGDTGTINNALVTNTKYDENRENLLHFVDDVSGFFAGQEVDCKLDWERRYKIMKLHAASHIMETYLFSIFGELDLLGCNVNDERDSSTYRFEGDFDNDKLLEVEKKTNEFIAKDYEIKRYEDKEKAGFWWWEAGDIKMPCGGTHPKTTGEIGKISITLDSNKKGKIKIRTAFEE